MTAKTDRGTIAIKTSRGIWLGTVRQWHWISSALCLIGMLLFAITGITLNHAGQIKVDSQTSSLKAEVPMSLLEGIAQPENGRAPLPDALTDWLLREQGIRAGASFAEWSEDEIYLALPRPGGDAWLAIDLYSGELIYEETNRGLIAFLNDLHKGRNTGTAWFWFIDAFSVACVVFCSTGLILLHRHSGSRPTTWPVMGLGLVIPLLLIILFIH